MRVFNQQLNHFDVAIESLLNHFHDGHQIRRQDNGQILDCHFVTGRIQGHGVQELHEEGQRVQGDGREQQAGDQEIVHFMLAR